MFRGAKYWAVARFFLSFDFDPFSPFEVGANVYFLDLSEPYSELRSLKI